MRNDQEPIFSQILRVLDAHSRREAFGPAEFESGQALLALTSLHGERFSGKLVRALAPICLRMFCEAPVCGILTALPPPRKRAQKRGGV